MSCKPRMASLRLFAAFAIAVGIALLLTPHSAFAATFTSKSPASDTTATVSPSTISVAVADAVPLLGTPAMVVDGVPRPATLSYVVITPGYWFYDEYDGVEYWTPPVYDYRRGTVSCAPGVLADGAHSVSVALASGTAPTTISWNFSIAEKPAFTAMVPASGTTTKTVTPIISAKVTDNSGVTTWTAAVDGTPVTAVYDAGTKLLRIDPGTLRNFASHFVSLSAADAAGNRGTASWTFNINGPETSWTNVFPVPGAVLSYSPWYVGVDVTCTSSFLPITRKVLFDGVPESTAVWIEPIKGDTKRGKLYAYPPLAAKDGTHTVTASVANTGGTTATYTWRFRTAAAPTLGLPSPAARSITTTIMPEITVPAADNSAVTSVAASVNGSPTPAAYDAARGVARVSLASPLPDDDDTTVTVTVFDALGLSAATTWTFEVQTGAVMSGNADVCFSCHPETYSDSTMDPQCSWCHSKHLDPSTSWHRRANITGCRPCHRSQLLIEHNRPGLTCMTCHKSTDTSVRAAIAAGDTRCASCHGARTHGASHTASSTCVLGCHSPIQSLVELKPVHDGATGTDFQCASCHPTRVDAVRPWDKTCGACHPIPGLHSFVDHTGTDVAYKALKNGAGCSDNASLSKSNCHNLSNIAVLHSKMPGYGCSVCHSAPNTPKRECLDCHHSDASTLYAKPSTATYSTNAYPSSDVTITPNLWYLTTPLGQPRYAVVNTPYPVSDTSRSVTVATSTAGGMLFGLDRSTQLVPDNAMILKVTVFAKGKAAVAGQRKMQGLFRIGGQDYQVGNASGFLSTSFPTGAGTALLPSTATGTDATRDVWNGESYTMNPRTGQRWTAAQLNGTDPSASLGAFGVALTSSAGANNVSLSQIYLNVTYYVNTPSPTVGTIVYHHDNVKYLHDPADAAGRRWGFGTTGGSYDILWYQDCYDFCHGYAGAGTFAAKQGSWMWYSVGGDPWDNVVATRTLTLKSITLPSASPNLTFDTNYILSGTSAGYVEISTDDGATWTPLTGTVGGTSRASLSGTAGGWLAANYDLAAYAGQAVKLRFRYENGDSYSEGWAFDNLAISSGSAAIFSDDAETLKPDWTNMFWTRSKQAFPYM